MILQFPLVLDITFPLAFQTLLDYLKILKGDLMRCGLLLRIWYRCSEYHSVSGT